MGQLCSLPAFEHTVQVSKGSGFVSCNIEWLRSFHSGNSSLQRLRVMCHAHVAEELTHTCWQMYHQIPTGNCHCALYLQHSGESISWAILCSLLCISERLWPQWACSDALYLYCRPRLEVVFTGSSCPQAPVDFGGGTGR